MFKEIRIKLYAFVATILSIMMFSIFFTYYNFIPQSEIIKDSVNYRSNTELISNYKERPNQYGKIVKFTLEGVFPIKPEVQIPDDEIGLVGVYSSDGMMVRYMIDVKQDIRHGDDVYMKINYIQEIIQDRWYIVYGEVLHYEHTK